MIEIRNLTPHPINFIGENGEKILTIESSGIARAAQSREKIGTVDLGICGIPINHSKYGTVEGLPDPENGVIYVVSALTAQAVPNRSDVFITDDAVRDEDGRVIGCRALAHI